GDRGHGQRVEGLEEQGPQTADVHGGVAVDPLDRVLRAEPPRPGLAVDTAPGGLRVRPRDPGEELQAEPLPRGTHRRHALQWAGRPARSAARGGRARPGGPGPVPAVAALAALAALAAAPPWRPAAARPAGASQWSRPAPSRRSVRASASHPPSRRRT